MSDHGFGIIGQTPIFSQLSREEIEAVHKLSVERHFERGDYVFMEGERRESVYFIERGLVKIFKIDEEGRENIVNVLGVGTMFPHVGFFQDTPYPGTAQTMDTTTLLAIACNDFDALLMKTPDIARKVMRVMGQRILQLQSKLQELAVFDSRDRVVALLEHFAVEHGDSQPDGVHIRLPITHGEMAQMVGITRESVNRIWNQLKRDGIISGEREHWIVNVERLR